MEDVANTIFGYGLVFIFGLVFGSFLNVVIYRLPIIEEREWRKSAREILEEDSKDQEGDGTARSPLEGDKDPKSKAKAEEDDKFTLLYPPSHCPKCHAPIKPFSNIPVLSWVMQKGRCKHCHEPISKQYPFVELLTGIMVLIVYIKFGYTLASLGAVLFTLFLISLMVIDAQRMLLLDRLTLPLIWLGLLFNIKGTYVPLQDAVLGAFWGYMSLWIVIWLFKLVTGKQGMGNGDFKLVAALGAWLGYKVLPIIIIVSCVVGIIASIIQRIRREQEMPFGPYLGTAGWLVMVFSDQINSFVQWWLGKSGF